MADTRDTTTYPPPESQGGWHCLAGDEVRSMAGMDPEKLERILEGQRLLWGGESWAIVVVRHGCLVREAYTFNVLVPTRFDIWSGTKSFTGTAYGILFDDVRRGLAGDAASVDLDTPAYAHIPEGYPLTDPRKEGITLRHLLSMSSGIPGESIGIFGLPVGPGINPLEAAVGLYPFTPSSAPAGLWVSSLASEPGASWDYADPAFMHLSLAFFHITGRELATFMRERVFDPLMFEQLTWDDVGIDDGRIGCHTKAISDIHVSARELARFGYLLVRGGVWQGRQLVAPWWTDLATRSSQSSNPGYGLTWWVNTGGALWDGVPHDAYGAMGFNTNLCCIIPSLDLVIVRIGAGPGGSTEEMCGPFLAAVIAAVTDV